MQSILPHDEFQPQEKNHEISFTLGIPSGILYDKSISHRQKILLMTLIQMARKEGYAWPSDKFLADQLDIDVTNVQRDLIHLEKLGFIERHTTQHGMKKIRHIYVGKAFSKYSYEHAPVRIPNTHQCVDGTRTSAYTKEEKKKEELEEKDLLRRCKKKEAVSSSDAKASSPTNQKKRFIDHVFLTDVEYQKLVNEFGEAKAKVYIKRLDAYIGSKGKKYKSHYKTILSWSLKDEKDGDRATESEKSDPRNHPLKGRSFVTINGKRTEVTHEKRKPSDEV